MGIDPDVGHRIIGTEREIADGTGLTLTPDAVSEDLAAFDLLYVPGDLGTRRLAGDPGLIAYLKTRGGARPVASVCTGALLLCAAGSLAGRRATTHHRSYDLRREVVTGRRIVDEGRAVTAGGVSSALSLRLYLVENSEGPAPARRSPSR
ncbi:MAG: hypothetical protein A2X52_22555 [Candidatus Rokubacteria bacterium GWC2_70_16]|nr:MAG: hypothetical protein A2X52_22555 [Candidatus Rokubacteria bacterium GWC2_70_16]OGL16281.1 MAG: hypothetical protein A3K12_07800 [Candidatus Rokubacteria bacterium RIFCSPLOWO2_12_FULL_71_19]